MRSYKWFSTVKVKLIHCSIRDIAHNKQWERENT